jgi:hypothetical protein
MANAADNNLFCFRVGKIKHAVITDADAKAVAVFQFLAAVWKRIFFQRENGLLTRIWICVGSRSSSLRASRAISICQLTRGCSVPSTSAGKTGAADDGAPPKPACRRNLRKALRPPASVQARLRARGASNF